MLALLRLLTAGFAAAFGAPAALIKGGALYGKARERALRWLLDMESVVRRLLLLRAALFPAPFARAIISRGRNAVRRRREGDAQSLYGPADDSARWPVHFRMPAPPEPQAMLSAISGGRRAREDQYELGHRVDRVHIPATESLADLGRLIYWVDDPRPLAERFEALLRVLNDPDHYAARLAQRLYFWRGRVERRQIFLESLCAIAPIANEARLSDEDWQNFAEARPVAQALLPVFAEPLRSPEPPAPESAPAAPFVEMRAEESPLDAAALAPPDAAPEPPAKAALKPPPDSMLDSGPDPGPKSPDDMSFDELVAEIEARMQAIRDSL